MAEGHLDGNVLGESWLEMNQVDLVANIVLTQAEGVYLEAIGPEQRETDHRADIDEDLGEPVGHLGASVLHVESVAGLYIVIIERHIVSFQCHPSLPIELLLWVEDF